MPPTPPVPEWVTLDLSTSEWSQGRLYDQNKIWWNYTKGKNTLQTPILTGDFKLELIIGIDTTNTGTMGFTLTEGNVDTITINNTLVNTSTIPAICTTKNQDETLLIERTGTDWTVTHGNDSVTVTGSDGDVKFWGNKSGNGSLYMAQFKYMNNI